MNTVIIPTHNKRDDVLRCLREVLAQARAVGDVEAIVIDDGSVDGTQAAVESVAAEGVPLRCLRLGGRGPAAARNAGIAAARGDAVVMVDDDAVPQPGWLAAMLAPFADPEVVGVEGKVQPVGGEGWGPLGMSPRNLQGGVFLTCNIAYRRPALLDVGGFDEGFPYPAFEDTDVAMQMRRLGRIAWAPDAVVHHPRRRWTLRRAVREIRFNEALTRFALRYGCLGWADRPTRHPRARIALAAIVTLPLGRLRKGFSCLRTTPGAALRFMAIAALQGWAAAALVWPAMAKGSRGVRERIGLPTGGARP